MKREEFEQTELDLIEEQKLNNLCPECEVSWEAITESLSSDGLDREEALLIINNCPTCREHFDYLLPTYSHLEVTMAGRGI